MKTRKLSVLVLGFLASVFGLTSCDMDSDNYNVQRPTALVTVYPVTSESFRMQLDDQTVLFPTNMKASPFGDKKVRALVSYEYEEGATGNLRNVRVNWIDSILTKRMAPDLGQAENVKAYGNDPVEIMRDWTTVAEDGYLTLRFLTRWGDKQPHLVNLVADNSANPYELTFHHKGNTTSGPKASGLVAFKLSDLPDTNGKTVDVKLKWTSFSGAKSITFKYCTNKSTDLPSETLNKMLEDISNEKNIK